MDKAERLIREVIESPEWSVFQHAADALGKIGPSAIAPLVEALKKDEHWYVRMVAARALGTIGDVRAIAPLVEALKSEDNNVRQHAAEALGQIDDVRVVPFLIEALKDRDSNVRRVAAEALGKIGDDTAVAPLIEALEDRDSDVRRVVAEVLGKIGDSRAVPTLSNTLNDEDWYVGETAAEALGKIGNATAVAPLIRTLNDEHSPIRFWVARALGQIGDARAVEHLVNLMKKLRDKDSFLLQVFFEAVSEALEKIRRRLAIVTKEKAASLLCPDCLCRFTEHQAKLGVFESFFYYACRCCHGSQFIDNVTKVVNVLDHTFDTPYVHQHTTLLVNWFQHKEPFDFDEVQINNSSDPDVEELLMKLRSSMDEKSCRRYKSMNVHLSVNVSLLPATVHALEGTFDKVMRTE